MTETLTWDTEDSAGQGTWRPATADLGKELGALLPLVDEHLGETVTRMTLCYEDWAPPHPRHLACGRLVRLGWFHDLPAGTVTVGHGLGPRTVLHVIAPLTSEVPS